MSQTLSPSDSPGYKTLAIRLDLTLHAQLSVIAQLRGTTITDEIRQAIEAHLTTCRSDPTLTAKADAVREDIERDAQTRRLAIASLFDEAATTAPAQVAEPSTQRRGRRTGGSES